MSIPNMILAQVTPADTMIQQAADTLQQAIDSAVPHCPAPVSVVTPFSPCFLA